MSAIQRFLTKLKLIQPPTAYDVLFSGIGNSGKTTLLYRLCLGEVVTTIPTMGNNVESLKIPVSRGQTLNLLAWDLGMGCGGGIPYLAMMTRFHVQWKDAIVYVIDASDKERFAESKEWLQALLVDLQAGEKARGLKRGIPILFLANKCDSADRIPLRQLQEWIAPVASKRLATIFEISATTGAGITEAFDWLNTAISITMPSSEELAMPSKVDTEGSNPVVDPRSPAALSQKLDSWVARTETDIPAEEFLKRFEAYDLPDWDHYTHIRIAYLMLEKYGRREGKDKIFEGLEAYIANNPNTKVRSFHVSMTYFWIQLVHFGMRSMPPKDPESSGQTELDPFAHFLLLNPYLVDGMIWETYYSKNVLMTPTAKTEMVLPDKKPLPNLVSRDAIANPLLAL